MEYRPLIVCAEMDPVSHEWLDGWRREFFPAERNHLRAHLALFHALPGERRDEVAAQLGALATRTSPIAATAEKILALGRGVAVGLAAPGLGALRDEVASRWRAGLTAQDAQPLRSHVTVCNKVAPARAREVEAELRRRFAPRPVALVSLELFAYAGGPWEPLGRFAFSPR